MRHSYNSFATSVLEGVVGEYHDQTALLSGKTPKALCRRPGGLGNSLYGHGKSRSPPGIRSPNRPSRRCTLMCPITQPNREREREREREKL